MLTQGKLVVFGFTSSRACAPNTNGTRQTTPVAAKGSGHRGALVHCRIIPRQHAAAANRILRGLLALLRLAPIYLRLLVTRDLPLKQTTIRMITMARNLRRRLVARTAWNLERHPTLQRGVGRNKIRWKPCDARSSPVRLGI